jgi:hypothetical protein
MVDEKGSRPETRHRRIKEKGFRFVDLGVSGGVEGARSGACFMAGGEAAAVEPLLQVLQMLSVEGGYGHAGPPGAGHFVKLVHNGINFGMLQAIAEGIDLISHYRDDLDIPGVLRCWRNGSVVRVWDYFPHDHARSRAFRWGEDGLAGICDRHQYLCFSIALWNGRDPILSVQADHPAAGHQTGWTGLVAELIRRNADPGTRIW